MTESNSRDNRARIWVAIVYPESAPQNWRDILDDEHVEWAESPLHDSDVNPGTGEVKKPHWHIVIAFDGKKSYEQVCELLKPLNGPIPKRCHALKGAVRYFAHLDNPEKHQYPTSAIIGHGGFDVQASLAPSASQRYEMIKEMQDWVKANGVLEMEILMDEARENHYEDWWPLLCDSAAYVMSMYVRSKRHRAETTAAAQTKCRRGGGTSVE